MIELLQAKPINHISVTELTSKADISRKTFYLHYNSIFEAKEDIDNDLIRKLKDIIASIPSEPHTVKENNLLLFFKQVDAVIKKHKALVQYFMLNTKQSSLYLKVKQLLKEAVLERIDYEGKPSVYNNYLAEFVVSGILSTYIEWNNRGRDLSDEALNAMLTKLCSSAAELVQ
ncbi:MAG: TetR/AcrR family transcriptional regulator [Paludibacteraceae bacterium]|nr:TetR/AcrR family transcriptional regulator [Paludibacteraceae bacterium]